MKLKSFLVGVVAAVGLLGPQVSSAYPANALQRGYVDAVGFYPYPGYIEGPAQTIGIRGWACVRPDLTNYGVPSTQVAVYQGAPRALGGIRVAVLDYREPVSRVDVASAGACSNANVGFTVWVRYTGPASYFVEFEGPYGQTPLEGVSSF